MLKSRLAKILLFIIIPVIITGLAFFYNYSRVLFSPGQVTLGHHEIEDSCFKCHAVFSKMSNACLSCHEKVKESIKGGKGFHGVLAKTYQENCVRCHTDHKGERYFIVKDSRNIDQLNTTIKEVWKLHQLADSLRKDIDANYFFHPEAQEKKYPNFAWSDHKKEIYKDFNHALTGYPLLGEHARVDCEKCHKSLPEFKESPKTGLMPSFAHKPVSRETLCYSCHQKSDEGKKGHKGKYGKDCSTCHLDGGIKSGWKALVPKVKNFHEDPKHLLKGKHVKTECRKCHETAPFKKKDDDKICYACHKKEDDGKKGHAGKYGKKCADCHIDGGDKQEWKDLIEKVREFHKDPKHELKGKHSKTTCRKCHETAPFEKKEEQRTCYSCHKNDDEKIHEESLGKKCESCHKEEKFSTSTFDHQKTKYPLLFAHKKVKCSKCHSEWSSDTGKKKIYRSIIKSTCFSCHARDDVHHGSFKNDCERCHRETYWGDLIGR